MITFWLEEWLRGHIPQHHNTTSITTPHQRASSTVYAV
jgi:hypothetical protein